MKVVDHIMLLIKLKSYTFLKIISFNEKNLYNWMATSHKSLWEKWNIIVETKKMKKKSYISNTQDITDEEWWKEK